MERHPTITMTNNDKLVTSSEPSGVSGDITRDDDVKAKMPGKSDELTSEKSLPDIPPLKKPVNVTSPVPEGERDAEKFYCEYCTDSFYTIDGVRQHTDNAHFRCFDEIYGDDGNGIFVDDPFNSDDKNEGPQTHEKNSRGRTKRKQEKSAKERNDSVGRRRRVRMATQQKETESSTEVIEKRRTRSKRILILKETKLREEEMKNVPEIETSLDMSKEEFVKSYNLRKKDSTDKSGVQREKDKRKTKRKSHDDKGGKDGKSENMDGTEKGTKDTDPNENNGQIVSQIDSNKLATISEDKDSASQNEMNVDNNGEGKQSQDIETAQDSAYRTENDTDTRNERSESTAVDDTDKDPDFDVEKEKEKNSDLTITAD